MGSVALAVAKVKTQVCPTVTASVVETESGYKRDDSPSTGNEATDVVHQLLSDRTQGVDTIYP